MVARAKVAIAATSATSKYRPASAATVPAEVAKVRAMTVVGGGGGQFGTVPFAIGFPPVGSQLTASVARLTTLTGVWGRASLRLSRQADEDEGGPVIRERVRLPT